MPAAPPRPNVGLLSCPSRLVNCNAVPLHLIPMNPRKYTCSAQRQAAYRTRLKAITPAAAVPLPHRARAAAVTVLFAHRTSHYKQLPGVEVYDQDRDARTWPGGTAVVAHPPCAQWGRLRALATVKPVEKELGPYAVQMVRTYGGVLEHPAGSSLWPACSLPRPGQRDAWGGFTLDVDQVIFGHEAQKRTWLYVCGCRPEALPPLPPPGRVPTHCVTSSRSSFNKLPELSKRARELTPPDLCRWLVAAASRCACAAPKGAVAAAIDESAWS